MVSLLNNAGIRLCFSKDAQLPQYPYSYLQDNYQNHMNSPNLLYSQPPPEAEPKKTKTSKKKAEHDKNARESSSLLECTKEDLIIWLNSLTLEERFEAFSIKNPWLAVAFVKMYKKWSESRDTIFRLLPEENPLNADKSNANFGDLDNHFYFRNSLIERMPHINKIEEILIQNVRIYDDNNLYNMIAFRDDLLQDMDQVIRMFNIISNDKAFTKPCHSISDHKNSGNVAVDKPSWFKPNEFATLAEWIVGSFEKAIWTKYLQNKKAPNKYSSAFEALDSKVTLSYKRSLVEFWSGLEKSKKKKIVSTANETFKWLNSPDSEQKSSDNGREINQGLRKLYEGPLFAQSKETTTAENINAYFTQLMEEKNDEAVIETILMTSLYQFGTISNLICRKLAHKLRNMLSEKIASDLILNEEREKKNSTKKKSKKKKAKKPAGNDANKADGNTNKAERIDCVETEEDDIQIEDITYEEDKRPQINITKIINNNPIPEKEAPKVNTLVGPVVTSAKNKKNKKEKAKAVEEVKAVEVPEQKPEGKTEKQEEIKTETRKNSQIDPWQQFDEFDKKVSKSQKRKMKKKQKNLEKEKLNDQAEENEKETETEKMEEEEQVPEDNKENDNIVNKPKEEAEVKQNIPSVPEPKNVQTKISEPVKEQKRDNRLNENKKKNNNERKNNDASLRNTTESLSSPTTPLLSKSDSITTKTSQKEEPSSARIIPAATPIDDSECGFIEVKPKKKLEKEPPQKERRDRETKGSGRRKKQKEETETRKPAKNNRRPKSPAPPTEAKKEQSEARSTKGNHPERSAPIVKCVVTEVTHKNNVGIPKVILGPALSSKPSITKSSKKETVDEKLEGSSNSSEGEGTPCNTRNTSHTSRSSHNPHKSPNETNIDIASEQKNNNANNNAKKGHPLSLASPSLDLETIKIAQAKDYANKYFNKKFETDIYKYVSSLTDEANKMTDYRIIAFRRLDHCITNLFPNFNVQTKIFGSCATGLALTSSDIDISVSGLEAYDRFALGDYLLLISNALNQFKWVTANDPILTASVPVLKLEIDLRTQFADIKEGQNNNKLFDIPMEGKEELNVDIPNDRDDFKIKVDLSVESLGMGYNYHQGYKTTAFVQRMLAKYESLYIVTMVLKQFLFTRRLLNIYKGGVSSYCLVIMIVALLQKFGDEGYMTTLRRFFSYYGEVFKPETTGISLIDKDPFFPLGHTYETAPFWIIVDNNFNRKNIGGGVYSIKVILHEFAKAFHTMETLRKKVEETAAKNHHTIHNIDDISKLELDQETQEVLKLNLLEMIVNTSELIPQGE